MTRAFIDGQIEALKVVLVQLQPQRADGKAITRLAKRLAINHEIQILESIRGNKI